MLPHLRISRNNLPPDQAPLIVAVEIRVTPEQAQSDLFSAIDFADENDFPRLCDTAISHGANVNATNLIDRHPIECAILRGSLTILRYLFARGALTPNPNYGGYDIVMLAARKGHADIVEFLITDGNMQNDAKDIQGMTALHRAVISRQTEAIKVLLEHGACPDTLTSAVRINELQKIFTQNLNELNIFSNGKNITPLMIATANQNYDAVNLLLEHNANTDIGAVPPLLIAIKNNDMQMIEILSREDAYSDQYPVLKDVGLIEYAIKNKISTECLNCLLKENSNKINLNSQQIFNLLAYSIKKDRPDYLALLLAAGMNAENDRQIHLLCANAHNSQYKISIHNMLASLNADNFEEKIKSKNIQSIIKLFDSVLNTYKLTEIGVFPPVTNKILQVFSDTKISNANITEEQINFALAVELGKGDLLNKNLFNHDFLNNNGHYVASEWIMQVKAKAELQFTILNKISNEIKDKKFIAFQELISINSINVHIKSKRNSNEIANILELIFINEIGLPSDLANLIADVFRSGFNFILSINPNNYQEEELALLAQKLITNLLNQIVLPQAITTNQVSAKFTEKLSLVLNKDGHHLKDFYASPFDYIKKLENRHNLRPPEVGILMKQLGLHLGLPPQFSQYITKAWSYSILTTAKLNKLTTPSTIIQAHKHQFARSLLDELETMSNNPYFFQEKFIEHAIQQLKNWCTSQLSQTEMVSGKRHASNTDEPDPKRQRQQ